MLSQASVPSVKFYVRTWLVFVSLDQCFSNCSQQWTPGRCPAETWTFFYGPVAVLLFCNLVFFLWTTCRLWKECNDVSVRHLRSMRFKCMLYMKLFLVMGVTWIFEVLSFAIENGSWYWIVTDILNSLQGVIIFFLVVCRKRVLRAVTRNKPCGFSCPNQWTAGLDEESETMLAGETELNPTNRSFLGRV
uniref:Uncharacterized protein n=1 Tax=Timema monikensis TaxID=170555 RepID=A0A7R9HPD3_9NEOP|nr:unnamed protein product [Timema monikensis]